MDGLTKNAAAIVGRMVALGWLVNYEADQSGGVWQFAKVCTVNGLGEFWRVGRNAELTKAADEALDAEAKGKGAS